MNRVPFVHKLLSIVLGLTVTVGLIGVVSAGSAQAAAAPLIAAVPAPAEATSAALPSFDQQMVVLINQARVSNGVPALREASGLMLLATVWSNDLATGQTRPAYQLAHNPNAWTMLLTYGAANRTSWGENVAWSSSTASTAQQIFTAYINSPGHRANILGAGYRYIGMGTVTGPGGLFNTTEFTDDVQSGQPVTAAALVGAENLVAAWYSAVLGRAPTSVPLVQRAGAMMNGQSATAAAGSIVDSAAGLTAYIQADFRHYLGRTATAAELSRWIGLLDAGANTNQMVTMMLRSDEAYANEGSTATGWIQWMYRATFGRAAGASEVAYWAARAAASSRTAVARAIAGSGEAATHRAWQLSTNYMGQPDTAQNAARAGAILARGDLTVAGELLGSAEYVNLH